MLNGNEAIKDFSNNNSPEQFICKGNSSGETLLFSVFG